MSKNVRIKVLCCHFDKTLADQYLTDGQSVGPCPIHEAGQEYIYEGNAVMPDGFCPWAWQDIYTSAHSLHLGASMTPWNNREGQTIVCCTDGIRPVVFELTAI